MCERQNMIVCTFDLISAYEIYELDLCSSVS